VVARALALSRIGFGVAMLVTPGLFARLWIGASGRAPGVRVLTRALGIRDVALGMGLLRATELGHDEHSWLVLGAASDAVDALATLAAFRHLPRLRRWIIVASAAGAASTAMAASQLEPVSAA
jgi:hypothetical protein